MQKINGYGLMLASALQLREFTTWKAALGRGPQLDMMFVVPKTP